MKTFIRSSNDCKHGQNHGPAGSRSMTLGTRRDCVLSSTCTSCLLSPNGPGDNRGFVEDDSHVFVYGQRAVSPQKDGRAAHFLAAGAPKHSSGALSRDRKLLPSRVIFPHLLPVLAQEGYI